MSTPQTAIPDPSSTTIRVALIGNPNTGKTTIFNALTGHRARVGNYAGVTVEKREGRLRIKERAITLLDLPGTYSLSAHSPDELVATEVLLGQFDTEDRPAAVVVVLDASNLERNLFLATQVLELGVPTILALNMMDIARENGLEIDTAGLSKSLGIPVIEVVARENKGVDELVRLISEPEKLRKPTPPAVYTDAFIEERKRLGNELKEAGVGPACLVPFLVGRTLLEAEGAVELNVIAEGGEKARQAIANARKRLEENGVRLRAFEATSRYRWIREHCGGHVSELESATKSRLEFSDRVDAILTHKVWGSLVFILLMALVFQAIYTWSVPLMDMIDGFFGALGGVIAGMVPEGPLQSFLVDGVIAGVGGVLVFLPQVCVLFLFIALLEDIGYMARAAFLMDRLLSRVGLSGRSFIPMLSSFACAIPGIMSARSIEQPRDRLATILVAPLMSCSARLPVYTIFIAAFVPESRVAGVFNVQGLVLLLMYFVGIAVAIPVALVLKKTLLKARTPPFLIELPPYRRPLAANVAYRVYERAREFVVRAGTIILAVSVVIWALSYYPRPASITEEHEAAVGAVTAKYGAMAGEAGLRVIEEALPSDAAGVAGMAPDYVASVGAAPAFLGEWESELAALEQHRDGEYLRQSFLGRMGRAIEPAVRPLGWDWRIGMATIASFPAREVIVATLGVIFDLGSATSEDDEGLITRLREATWPDGRPLFTLPVALSIMVFFALCLQCAATLAIIKQETNSWRWPVFAFVYMTLLAYLGALATYQIGALFIG